MFEDGVPLSSCTLPHINTDIASDSENERLFFSERDVTVNNNYMYLKNRWRLWLLLWPSSFWPPANVCGVICPENVITPREKKTTGLGLSEYSDIRVSENALSPQEQKFVIKIVFLFKTFLSSFHQHLY